MHFMPCNAVPCQSMLHGALRSMGHWGLTLKGGVRVLPVQRGTLNMEGAATSCISSFTGAGWLLSWGCWGSPAGAPETSLLCLSLLGPAGKLALCPNCSQKAVVYSLLLRCRAAMAVLTLRMQCACVRLTNEANCC